MSFTTDDAPPAIARPEFAPGTVIADRYRIEARLGAGGGGTVFRCVDQTLGATVALKVVSSEGDSDLGRWRREVAMARQITDRNVCRVHDLGETAELRFVTMELVEGASLRSSIRPDLSAADARALIEQLIAGVAAIHVAGIVHRDLKPENVVVAADGRAVIVDFGLAKTPTSAAATRSMRSGRPEPSVTRAGFVVGTPRYMSPEQAAGEPVDTRTDVWALGLIAHELLTGAMPELDADGPMVSPVVEEKWPGGGAILKRCLALDPAARFDDAPALRAALVPTTAKRRPRWPFFVAAAGASAVIGFAVVKATRTSGDSTGSGSGSETAPVDVRVTPSKLQQLTTTTAKQWPEQAPTSVALDPTATKIAYTTGEGRVHVRALAGGAPIEWAATVARRDKPQPIGTPRVVGWFADGSVAVTGTTASAMHLIRVRADGTSDPLYESTTRFRAAVSPKGDRIAVADVHSIRQPDGKPLASLDGAVVVALAWSTDGKLVSMRVLPDGDVIIDLEGTELWRGRTQLLIDPLLTFAGARIALSYRDGDRTSIALLDPETRKVTVHEQLAGHVGAGNAVNGTLVLVRGPVHEVVQIRDRFATRTVLAHADGGRASHVAGWTTKGAAVFRLEDRVVASTAAGARSAWLTQPWPGTQAADIPVAVVGDDVIVRRADGSAWLVERVTGDGTRTRLGRFEHASELHCRTACVLQQRDGVTATWTDVDPTTGALGKLVFQSPDNAPRSFALSPDGSDLAITSGNEALVLFDRATSDQITLPTAAISTRWSAVAFGDGGDVWATAVSLDMHPMGLVRFRNNAGSYVRPSVLGMKAGDALRWFGELAIRGTDRDLRIAIATKELRLEIWRADGF